MQRYRFHGDCPLVQCMDIVEWQLDVGPWSGSTSSTNFRTSPAKTTPWCSYDVEFSAPHTSPILMVSSFDSVWWVHRIMADLEAEFPEIGEFRSIRGL